MPIMQYGRYITPSAMGLLSNTKTILSSVIICDVYSVKQISKHKSTFRVLVVYRSLIVDIGWYGDPEVAGVSK